MLPTTNSIMVSRLVRVNDTARERGGEKVSECLKVRRSEKKRRRDNEEERWGMRWTEYDNEKKNND